MLFYLSNRHTTVAFTDTLYFAIAPFTLTNLRYTPWTWSIFPRLNANYYFPDIRPPHNRGPSAVQIT